MKITKIAITIILSLTIILGLMIASLGVLTYTNGIVLTNIKTSSFSPQVFKNSLTISAPTPVTETQSGDLLILGANTDNPQIGEKIDSVKNKTYYSIRAYTDKDKTDITTYNTANNIHKIAFSVPLLGILTALLNFPILLLFYIIFTATLVGVYFKLFWNKKPKKVKEPEPVTSQIMILKEMFEEAPEFRTRAEQRKYRKNIKKQTLKEETTNV